MIEREHNRGRAIAKLELGEDVTDVALHCRFAHEQRLGDLLVCRPLPDRAQHVYFSRS